MLDTPGTTFLIISFFKWAGVLDMKMKIINFLGVCYVVFALVATSGAITSLHRSSSVQGNQDYLEQENHGGDQHSQRLFGYEGLQEGFAPRDDGRYGWVPIQAIAPAAEAREARMTLADLMDVYQPNCMIVWTADWCPACKKMYPVIKKLEANGYAVYVLDYDKNRALALKMGVKSLPTTIIREGGMEVARHVGPVSAITIKKDLRKNDGTSYLLW